MDKKIIMAAFVIILFDSIQAQQTRGTSKAGRIENPLKKMTDTILKSEKLECEISYEDPSGDQTLSEGETGKLVVLVRNKSPHAIPAPQLELSSYSSWNPKVNKSVKWMEKIEAGGMGRYSASLQWDAKIPAGSATYSVRVMDGESGISSDPAEVTFTIAGTRIQPAEPVFVDVDKAIPKVLVSNTDGIAVIIGNKEYTNPDVPNVDYAANDATIIKQYLVNMLGFREENIIFIEDAEKADFEQIFGTKEIHEGKLYNWVKPNQSDVFIYYSGHGAPDTKNKKAYFMPANCDMNYVQIGGYPLEVFYQNLEKLPAKSITIVLDACFSGGSQQGMLIKDASPMYIDVEMPLFGNKFNLITSATGDQIASWYPEGNHSLFTYYFLRALRGEADIDRDRKITIEEIDAFLKENVPYMARRLYNREQTPIVKGSPNRVICSY